MKFNEELNNPKPIEDTEIVNSLSSDLDFQRLLLVADKSKGWVLLFLFVSVISGLIYLRYTVPVYESSTIIQIVSNNAAQQVLSVENPFEKNDIQAEVEFLKSKFLLERALKKLPLEVSYFNKGQFLSYELYKNSPFTVEYEIADSTLYNKPFHFTVINENLLSLTYTKNGTLVEKEFGPEKIELEGGVFKIKINNYATIVDMQNQLKQQEFTFIINTPSAMVDKCISNLNITLINPSAQTIQISFRDNNSTKAKDIAETLANEFKLYDVEKRSQSSRKVLEFIEIQLDLAYNRLKLSETNLQQYKKQNNLSDVDQFASLYLDKLNRFENEIIDLDLQLNVLKEIEAKINSGKNEIEVEALLPILAGTEYETSITTYIAPLKELSLKRQRALQETTAGYEAVKVIDQQIALHRKLLTETITSLRQKLFSKKQELVSKAGNIQNKFLNIPEKELEYARLQRMSSIDEKFFSLLLEKKTEFSISEAGFVPQHIILENAQISAVPISPKKNLVIITFFACGLVISILFVLMRYLFYRTISSIGELEKILNAPLYVLGGIPNYKKEMPVSQLIVNQNPKSLIAESFRNVRSNLQFISSAEGSKIIAITSTISGEGKTFISINIGGIFAFSGKKVIILDMDMRKPKIHVGFGVDNTKGMSSILIKTENYKNCINKSLLENLDFITAGPIPPNPSELILNGNINELLESLKKEYDYVIIDNPPIGLVTDGLSLMQKADYPIYVFRADYSKRMFVKNAEKLYYTNKIKNLCAVINGVNINKSYYGKGYNYGYNSSYTNDYYVDDTQEQSGVFKRFFRKK
ncbi:MAG: polysaccharide biosynthesis tyrosine autokinase [Flavobacteriales bacterium]|nr:polysaccharide biosynthesis tyrosine autokinase [Flavobacteriales bacterium]